MVRTQLYLAQNQLLQLKKIAFQEDISLSSLLRKWVDEGLGKNRNKYKKVKKIKRKTAGDILLAMARKAEKIGWEGPKDLASNVDKYLYGRI